jgi:hypothetical protein
MRERMLAGDLYVADDPELAERNLRAMDLMEAFNATPARAGGERRRLLEELELAGPHWQTPAYAKGDGAGLLAAAAGYALVLAA